MTATPWQRQLVQLQGDSISGVVLDRVVLRIAEQTILDDVTLTIDQGELVSVIGPSGSGKTSLLRAVAGLDPVAAGSIFIDGRDVTNVPSRERDVAMVFQEAVLFPFLNVEDNVGLPLDVRSVNRDERRRRVHAEGRALGIESILEHWPREISAGHQQLVQVARAMVRVPSVFLLDEPLSRVDAGTRTRLRTDLRRIQQGYGVTTIHVTNDPVEAMAIADRVAVMDNGRIVQTGTPLNVYGRPDSRFVAELMGDHPMNFLRSVIESDGDGVWLTGDGFRVRAWSPALIERAGQTVTIGVRPEDVVADTTGIPVVATRFIPLGSHREVELALGDARIWMRTSTTPDPSAVRFVRWHVFDASGRTLAHLA